MSQASGPRVAAFFDVDGTLARTTLLHPLIWYEKAHRSPAGFAIWFLGLLCQAPWYLIVDSRSRSQFNIVFFRRYRGLPAQEVADWHRSAFATTLQRAIYGEAVACLAEHKSAGHHVVLVTGGLDLVMQPLAESLGAEGVLAAQLEVREGRLTGELRGPPVADEQKAVLMRDYAQKHNIDLRASYAYGNSWGDVPMLECTGNPVAVNPDRKLQKLAQEKNWPIRHWK